MEPIILTTKPDISRLPGGWEPGLTNVKSMSDGETPAIEVMELIPGATILKNVLTKGACQKLIALMQRSPNFESVSIQGRKDIVDDRMGSKRTTMWSPELAECFWQMVKDYIPNLTCDENTLTDWWQGDKTRTEWEPVAFSPMLRFMRYEKAGEHYAHYDAGFIYPNDNYRSLKSVVIYLTTNTSGETRFIEDDQTGPVWDRNHDDFIKRTEIGKAIAASVPEAGNILIFDHRMCHDVAEYKGDEGSRIIIRGDIVYKAK